MARDSVTIEGLDTIVRRLKALGPEASKRGGPVRAALRKGGVVLLKQARANLQAVIDQPNAVGLRGPKDGSSGLMVKSLRLTRGKRGGAGEKGETYILSIPKRVRYPSNKRTPSGIPVVAVAAMIEYGTSKQQVKPWMEPAFAATREQVVNVARDELLRRLDKLERQVAASVR